MPRRKLPILTFSLVTGAVVFISVVFWIIATSISGETWKSIGYPSAFLLGFIGAASIVIPVPTTVALLGMATSKLFNPAMLGLAFGVGAGIGQLTSYVVGYTGRDVMGGKHAHRLGSMLKIFERYGMIAVFIFALTPLPDSLLFIPLGLVHYSLWKVFVAGLAGKISMSLIITYFGEVAGQTFTENWTFAAVTTILLVLIIITMFKIDWEKIVKRYIPKESKKRRR